MIQVKLTEDSKFGKKGSVLLIERNEAHTIIDSGLGRIYKRVPSVYKNRMMSSEKKIYRPRKKKK